MHSFCFLFCFFLCSFSHHLFSSTWKNNCVAAQYFEPLLRSRKIFTESVFGGQREVTHTSIPGLSAFSSNHDHPCQAKSGQWYVQLIFFPSSSSGFNKAVTTISRDRSWLFVLKIPLDDRSRSRVRGFSPRRVLYTATGQVIEQHVHLFLLRDTPPMGREGCVHSPKVAKGG